MTKIARTTRARKDTFSGSIFVGVDVHKKSYSVSILDEEGTDKTFSMPAEPHDLVKKLLMTGCPVNQVVYEAGPCGFGLYRTLMANGMPAAVAAPTRMPRPISRTGKTVLIVANLRNMPHAVCWLPQEFRVKGKKA